MRRPPPPDADADADADAQPMREPPTPNTSPWMLNVTLGLTHVSNVGIDHER
eukprot:m.189232 g.189232  ORF g.189232 m.189232 type:complete len:52 (-) comp32367_c0_seq4:165-320(-)